jgi:hypothetical protein
MRLSALTTIGAAAALALALGFAGTPVLAQGMPDQPSAGAGPSGPEGGGGPAMSESGGGGAGMPAPQDREMGAGPEAGAPPAGMEAEKTLPSDEGAAAGKSGTKAEGAGKTGTDTEMKGAGKAGAETKMEKGEKAAGTEMKESDKAGAELKGRSRAGAEVEGDAGKTGTAETEMKGGEGKAAVKIDSGQKTKITSYFQEHKPDVKVVEKSSVSVSIGVAVPAAISLHPLPPDIIVVAGDCSLLYFVWGGDLVLVDSCSRHVVDIIPGVV